MTIVVRPATPADWKRIATIAAEGDSEAGPRYLAFVAAHGRLLAAERDGDAIAFGGMVPVPLADGRVAAMVTDLFVAADVRGRGVGGVLLEHLLAGWPLRMTASSKHPAALPAYARVGMTPRWPIHYLEGTAAGGGLPLRPAPWAHDRRELVQYFADEGAMVTADAVVHVADHGAEVLRLHHHDAVTVMTDVLAALPTGMSVTTCVHAAHPLTDHLLSVGFREFEHDVFCASPGLEFPGMVGCVHAGLA